MTHLYPSWYSSPPTGNVVPPCGNPDSFEFWDERHASSAPLAITEIVPMCPPHPVLHDVNRAYSSTQTP